MQSQIILFFARTEHREANEWLAQHPMALGLMFLAIGLVIGGWGLYELLTGTAHDKRGRQLTGGTAKALAIVRIVAGVACLGFAIFKMIAG
jgi:hypothetical protein